MKRFAIVALAVAALLGARPAAAAAIFDGIGNYGIVYTQTGKFGPFHPSGGSEGPAGQELLGADPIDMFVGGYVAGGNYSYDLEIDPAALTSVTATLARYRSFGVYYDGHLAGGADTFLDDLPDPSFHATATGFAGTFSSSTSDTTFDDARAVGFFSPPPGTQTTRIVSEVKVGLGIRLYADQILPATDYRLTLSSIPEPATWILLLAGFYGVGVRLRSRRVRRSCSGLSPASS
ncbi:PEP-CTERM sorting domain-containing protein [Phenylobacterium sp.]|uniref:PEP-CTERM sorting domain-containing protein n=1 Tax=Phenylobacterium sp. TaxID=1871053 RepID=UPI003568A9CE